MRFSPASGFFSPRSMDGRCFLGAPCCQRCVGFVSVSARSPSKKIPGGRMFFHEVPANCLPRPGESIWKAVEYQPAGHLASLQLWNFPPMSLPEPLPSPQLSKGERDGHVQWERFSSALDDSCVCGSAPVGSQDLFPSCSFVERREQRHEGIPCLNCIPCHSDWKNV